MTTLLTAYLHQQSAELHSKVAKAMRLESQQTGVARHQLMECAYRLKDAVGLLPPLTHPESFEAARQIVVLFEHVCRYLQWEVLAVDTLSAAKKACVNSNVENAIDSVLSTLLIKERNRNCCSD